MDWIVESGDTRIKQVRFYMPYTLVGIKKPPGKYWVVEKAKVYRDSIEWYLVGWAECFPEFEATQDIVPTDEILKIIKLKDHGVDRDSIL